MRVAHCSDLHSKLVKLSGNFDLVIDSGDFFPTTPCIMYGDKLGEGESQLIWLEKNISQFKNHIQGKPYLFTFGNHDFADPELVEQYLRSENIDAYNLNNKSVMFQGINFYGFPYIPYINGEWNYELHVPEMQIEFDKVIQQMKSEYIDVLVCHAPPAGILDVTESGESIGSTVIANGLYWNDTKIFPTTVLFGHVHYSYGITVKNNILYSNAATTSQILEI